ncbi:hypothetical protein A6F55_09330 [Prescottella equi]|uniref:hypothetical protein n=1 Tax=Rhodococcus hoagii TaxID=43767 RepID=UPI000A1157F4|nr:hypothetical protein [Prescottella equi]ORL03411.1 hypothetical protein A6F55_09330 [Prescottella equi]
MHPRFSARHPFLVAFGALFALGVIVTYWWLIVAAVVVAGLAYGSVKLWQHHQASAADAAAARAAVAARADYEHQQYLAGNPVGTYGQYAPPSV